MVSGSWSWWTARGWCWSQCLGHLLAFQYTCQGLGAPADVELWLRAQLDAVVILSNPRKIELMHFKQCHAALGLGGERSTTSRDIVLFEGAVSDIQHRRTWNEKCFGLGSPEEPPCSLLDLFLQLWVWGIFYYSIPLGRKGVRRQEQHPHQAPVWHAAARMDVPLPLLSSRGWRRQGLSIFNRSPFLFLVAVSFFLTRDGAR